MSAQPMLKELLRNHPLLHNDRASPVTHRMDGDMMTLSWENEGEVEQATFDDQPVIPVGESGLFKIADITGGYEYFYTFHHIEFDA